MKTNIIFVFTILLCIACSSNQETTSVCNVDNPLEDLAWLKEIKENLEKSVTASKSSITQYSFNNESVFLINTCENCNDAVSTVYNCSGTKVCENVGKTGESTCSDFFEKAKDKKVLWQNYNTVIIDKDLYDATKINNYTIKKVVVYDEVIKITITSSGCDGSTWSVNLIDSGAIAKSLPAQRYAKIQLKNEEACLSIATKEFTFNISDLKVGEEIILNLKGWDESIILK